MKETSWQARARGRLENAFASEVLSLDKLLAIFRPILLEQVFFTAVSLLSIWMIALKGEAGLSVVNMMTVVNQVFISVCLGLVTGGTVVVAQYVGAKKPGMAAHTMLQTMAVALLFTVVLGAVLVVRREAVVGYLLAGAPQEVLEGAVLYFTGFCISFPFYALYQSFAGAMRGWGKTRVALLLSVLVNCTELLVTAVLVIGLEMGVAGMALSVVFSRLAGAVAALLLLLRGRRELGLRFSQFALPCAPILRGVLLIAVPLALEQFFFNSGKAFSQRFIAGYGTNHMAANGVVNAVFNLINIPQATLTAVAVTVVGMCVGAGAPALAKRYIQQLEKTVRRLILLLLPLTVPLSVVLTQAYHLSDEAHRLTLLCLALIVAMGPLFLGGSFLVPAGLRAGGDAVFVSAAALCCMWTVRVGFSYVFTKLIPLGVVGINLAMVIEWALRTLLYRLRLSTPVWCRHRLIAER